MVVSGNTSGGAGNDNGGGGIYNAGDMTLTNCTFSNNIAGGDTAGGGIYNAATLTLIGSTVTGNTAQLANISTRGLVEAGNNVLIGGFILGGDTGAMSDVLIRALGPSLTDAGVAGAMANPTLELRDAQGVLVSNNDDWVDSPQKTEIEGTGIPPTNPMESALFETLNPGALPRSSQVRVAGRVWAWWRSIGYPDRRARMVIERPHLSRKRRDP